MKQTINLGAYGWRHKHWIKSFYPEDLPVDGEDDWRLSYYSNEFDAVMVPAGYWQGDRVNDCEYWLDSVHSGFQFFVECHGSMFESITLDALIVSLKKLQPQLSALVLLDDSQPISQAVSMKFLQLADALQVKVIGSGLDLAWQSVWRPDGQRADSYENSELFSFAFIESDLSDLRQAREMVEQYAAQLGKNESEATLIIEHAHLQAHDLGRLRSVLDMMGY